MVDLNLFAVFFKILVLALTGVYAAFAFVLIRQVRMMRDTIKTDLGPMWTVFALTHFLAVIGVFLVAVIVL